ncbi:MAG: hypothetical protein RR091_08190 [Cloacibacillus sp.]
MQRNLRILRTAMIYAKERSALVVETGLLYRFVHFVVEREFSFRHVAR